MGDQQFGSRMTATPPYAAYGSFEEFIRRAADEGIPTSIDKAILVSWDIAAGNESGLLTTLRSLGIVDDAGRPTELYREIRLSPTRRRPALLRCVEVAYPGLSTEGPSIDADQLHDYFVEDRGLTGQMVDKAMRFYRRIMLGTREETGPSDRVAADSVARRPRRPPLFEREATAVRSTSSPAVVLSRSRRRSSRRHVIKRAMGDPPITIQVTLAPDIAEDALVDLFRRLRRAWSRSNRSERSPA